MEKLITKKIFSLSVISLIVLALIIMLIQFLVALGNAKDTSILRLEDGLTKLASSDKEIAELVDSLNEDYISKTRTFAKIIEIQPNIVEDFDTLMEIQEDLGVDELHVTDENGVIRWGTITGYYGFDFNSSDQTRPFIKMLTDSTYELVQEAQANGATGKYFQYIGVPRRDKVGIVQIGMEPKHLADSLKNNTPEIVLDGITVGQSGELSTISKSDLTVVSFIDDSYLGKPSTDIGLDANSLQNSKFEVITIGNKSYYCRFAENESYYLVSLYPVTEITGDIFAISIITVILIGIILVILTFNINKSIRKDIISGITQIVQSVDAIGNGNSEVKVNIRSCSEFEHLSDGINGMVDSIQMKIRESSELNESMKSMIDDITAISKNINDYSGNMSNTSVQITNGSSSQAATVEELSAMLLSLSKQVNENAKTAESASKIADNTIEQLKIGSQKMVQMQSSMEHISTVSQKISNIVKTIDDIAFQTNILALNAAVEAARAGQHGKGFAVVADEVRNLANKSADAVKGTTSLIEETLTAVEKGAMISSQTAEEFNSMMSGAEISTKLISEISNATASQAESIEQAAQGMTQISDVATENSTISFEAQDIASMLDEEARKLMSLVENN